MISCYLSGKYEAKDENLSKLAVELGVSEPWLRGYDVPINNNFNNNYKFDELELLFSKNKDILTEDDKDTIRYIIEKRKREIDKQLGND